MVVVICLAIAAVLYSAASYASYTESVRNSNWFLAITLFVSVISSSVWMSLVRHLNDNNKIIAASLMWDALITMVYAVIPALLASRTISWQALVALVSVVLSLFWFKLTTS